MREPLLAPVKAWAYSPARVPRLGETMRIRVGFAAIAAWCGLASVGSCGGDDANAPSQDAGLDTTQDGADAFSDGSEETDAASDVATHADASSDAARDARVDADAGRGCTVSTDGGLDAGSNAWTLTKVGSPTWRPAGLQRMAGQFGIQGCPAPFVSFLDGIGQPNHPYSKTYGAIGASSAHSGPYDDEWRTTLATKGISDRSVFDIREFTAPSGVYILFVLVPADCSLIGTSADGVDAILQNSLFPIANNAVLYRNGVSWDPNNTGNYPPQTVFYPQAQGASHVMLAFEDNDTYGAQTPVEGSYEWHITLRDSTSNGWDVVVPYEVVVSGTDAGVGDGGCGDTTSDPYNCGSCGHSCNGAHCLQSICEPTVLTPNGISNFGVALALDAPAATLFFDDGMNLSSLPTAGGAPTVLFPNVIRYDPLPLAMDGTNLYWFGGGGVGGLQKTAKASGTTTNLLSLVWGTALAVDATSIYWADVSFGNHIVRVTPISGGATTDLLQNTTANGMAVDATNLFYSSGTTLYKVPKTGGSPSAMFTVTGTLTQILFDGTWIYALETQSSGGRRVLRVPPAGGSYTAIVTATGTDGRPSGGFTIDATNVYFSVADETVIGGVSFSCSTLFSAPLGGGTKKTLATDYPSPATWAQIAVDASYVYFSSSDFRRGVLRVPR